MGVSCLETFIRENHNLEDIKLLNCCVVMDGNGLYHFIRDDEKNSLSPYAGDIQGLYAGDYPQFEKSARRFFKILQDCGIKPYVVFDGAMDKEGRKWITQKNRAKKRLKNAESVSSGASDPSEKVTPLLTFETFRQVLNDQKIPHVTCDYEGDAECVALANHLKCPVMARDSDFFVFDLKDGYIPFYTLTPPIDETLPAKCYLRDRFLSRFDITDPRMMPLFATLMGNDWVGNRSFDPFFCEENFPEERPAKMKTLLNWLKGHGTYEQALCKILNTFDEDLRSIIRTITNKSVELYINRPQNVVDYVTRTRSENVSSELTLPGGRSLPDQFNRLIRKGQVSRSLMNVLIHGRYFLDTQVEKMTEESAYQCSKPVRAATYAILRGRDTPRPWVIHEYHRIENRIQEVDVTIEDVEVDIASLRDIVEIQLLSADERRSMVLDILRIGRGSFIESQQKSENVKLVLMTLIYCCQKTNLSECHLMAVLILLSIYKAPISRAEAASSARKQSGIGDAARFDINIVHAFAQFQACFFDILHLNQIFGSPFASPSPARFYDGKLLHDLTEILKSVRRENREQFVCDRLNRYDQNACTTFQQLYRLVGEHGASCNRGKL